MTAWFRYSNFTVELLKQNINRTIRCNFWPDTSHQSEHNTFFYLKRHTVIFRHWSAGPKWRDTMEPMHKKWRSLFESCERAKAILNSELWLSRRSRWSSSSVGASLGPVGSLRLYFRGPWVFSNRSEIFPRMRSRRRSVGRGNKGYIMAKFGRLQWYMYNICAVEKWLPKKRCFFKAHICSTKKRNNQTALPKLC